MSIDANDPQTRQPKPGNPNVSWFILSLVLTGLTIFALPAVIVFTLTGASLANGSGGAAPFSIATVIIGYLILASPIMGLWHTAGTSDTTAFSTPAIVFTIINLLIWTTMSAGLILPMTTTTYH